MKLKTGSTGALLVGVVTLFALSGCDQIDQAVTDAVEKAKTSAGQLLEDASQARSIDDARQVADDALVEAREQAAGLLEQASDFLSTAPDQAIDDATGAEDPAAQ